MKTILIDCRFAALNVGLGRYARELVVHLLRRSSNTRFVLLVRKANEEWIPQGAETLVADIPHYSLAEQITLPRIIRNSNADLLFSPHFNVPLFCPIPFVVTVHDLILHRYPNRASFLKQVIYRTIIGHAVRKAEAIVAVSEFTAHELADMYGSNATKKLSVIHEGVSEMYRPVHDVKPVLDQQEIHRPYFLYVGNAKQHKNVPLLLEAFQKSGITDADLLLVSGGPEMQSLTLPPNARVLSSISDTDLPALYSAARCFVTASLYEGYCLPVAEALACGCPVIATNRTAIPETAAGHAMLIEPTVDAFSAAFKNPPMDRIPFIVGTWEKAAKETEALLIRTING
jgi:glycosyltransferase involved in cell wall biosynthesis